MSVLFLFKDILLAALLLLLILVFTMKTVLIFKKWKTNCGNKISVGFFHPYCNAGGGGERVLWAAIRAVQKEYKEAHCIIYSGDTFKTRDVLDKVQRHFNIKLTREVEIVHLKKRNFVEAKYYPYFTLLFQSMGSIVLGFEALFKHVPDIYIDTMGYTFTLPIFKVFGSCRVGAYVHYPTISTDMLELVQSRKTSFNNRPLISNNKVFTRLKLIYYKLFAFSYGFAGRFAEVIMVNSSWTRGHILEIWKKSDRTFTVYPPCDVAVFNSLPLNRAKELMKIISIAQFRPEKNHELQIKAFCSFLKKVGGVTEQIKLVLIGSCRHAEDFERVDQLKDLCSELNLTKNVEFKINLSFDDMINEMKNSSVAIHSMINEHFGISVVECMAAGLIMIAHDSGGPKMDIICCEEENQTGFLASDVESFVDCLERVYRLDEITLNQIRENARKSTKRFSDENFENTFISVTKLLFM